MHDTSRSSTDSLPVQTLIPGQSPIDLCAYYLDQVDYYLTCELQTKRWFVENVRSDWVMFDIGANIGYYSILFSRLAPTGEIYAFEPTTTFTMLKENLAYSKAANVKAMQVAVGLASGQIEDNVFRIWGQQPERLTYTFSTVDDLVRGLGLMRLDCMKIDVDSFDFEVLMGAEETLERLNPWIVVELSHALSRRDQSVQQALEWLANRGYRSAHALDHVNTVLRRNSDDLTQKEPSIRLTFERRPVVVPDRWSKSTRLENLFVADPTFHNKATAGANHTVHVPGPRWTFAASWHGREGADTEQPIIVEIELQVSGGSVGLGCVTADFSSFVGKEISVAPDTDFQTIRVVVEDTALAKHLVLRNVDPAGREANVIVGRFSCFAAIRNSRF